MTPSPRSLGAGSPPFFREGFDLGGRVSISDSEEDYSESEPPSPPPEGRGKGVAPSGGRRRRARRRRRHEGFMAAARNSHHAPPASPPQMRASTVAHPPRALEEPDTAGFYQVWSRRRWRRRSPPKQSRLVPPALVGLCFNCLASSHVKADCVFPARCFNCLCEGHRAAACPLPPLGGKRRRPPSRSLLGRRVARRPDFGARVLTTTMRPTPPLRGPFVRVARPRSRAAVRRQPHLSHLCRGPRMPGWGLWPPRAMSTCPSAPRRLMMRPRMALLWRQWRRCSSSTVARLTRAA